MPNGLFVRLFFWLAWLIVIVAGIGLLIVIAIGLTNQDDRDSARRPVHTQQEHNGHPPDRPLKQMTVPIPASVRVPLPVRT